MLIKNHLQKISLMFMLWGTIFSPPGGGIRQAARGPWAGSPPDPTASTQAAEAVEAFSPITAVDGWIVMDQHLYWTGSGGETWSDITPLIPADAIIYAVKFLNPEKGWVLWANHDEGGSLLLQIASTLDRGASWTSSAVASIAPDDPDVNIDSASMDWLDADTGWFSMKRMTGSNFSAGVLFRTEDGARTWTRSALPIAGPVTFADDQVGWTAGGPTGQQLFETLDGGRSWEEKPAPALPDAEQLYSVGLPVFHSQKDGLLPLVTSSGSTFKAGFYSTLDGGLNWAPVFSFPLNSQNGTVPLAILDPQHAVATVPAEPRVIHVADGVGEALTNTDGLSAGVIELKMLTPTFGWSKWHTGECQKPEDPAGSATLSISCTQTTRILRTSDGGLTWEEVSLPGLGTESIQQTSTVTASSGSGSYSSSEGNTLILTGQGFDRCEIPSLAQLQTWWRYSPYQAVNLYIGGSARACSNIALTASYLTQMRNQGWTFIPTWVGPQAPCTNYLKKFDYDPDTAYAQGMAEADAAVDKLAALGLTFGDQTGSVVYYDLESYPAIANCRTAVNSFMNGWVSHLHSHGNKAGAYASTLKDSGLADFMSIANVPDIIWPARWYHNAGSGWYDPTASVWNLGLYVPNTAWVYHQRILQYEGDHSETWGGTLISSIDNDVLDGVVAVPFLGDPSEDFSASPLAGTVPMTVVFHLSNTAFMSACHWDYGDGQTGTSCAIDHSHTYLHAGTYTVTFSVDGTGGIGHLVRSNYITVSQPASYPDLIPSARPGETNPVVLSSLTGTTVENSLSTGQPVYADWGVKNNSSTDFNQRFSVGLFINDQPVIQHTYNGLAAGASAGFDDWKIAWGTAGCFPVRLEVDFTGNVAESDENNNSWTGRSCWGAESPAGPTLVAPSGSVSGVDPAFQWQPVSNAESYELIVYSLGTNQNLYTLTGIPAGSVCTDQLCSYPTVKDLGAGDYQFKVGVISSGNAVIYSPWMTFTVGSVPSVPGSLLPVDLQIITQPAFTWNSSPGASWYDLYVYPGGLSIPIIAANSIPASSICPSTTCAWIPAIQLPGGYYTFRVRAGNFAGASGFSPWQKMTVSVENTTRFISGNAGIAGAVLHYIDGTSRSVAAGSDGNYLLPVLDDWSGTVTPVKLGYVFTPAQTNLNDVTVNQAAQNYSAVYTTHSISGSAGMAGVTLSYQDGTPKTVTTGAGGTYSISLPHGWSGTLTPSKAGYFFVPSTRSYTDLASSQTGQDFVGHLWKKIFMPLLVKP